MMASASKDGRASHCDIEATLRPTEYISVSIPCRVRTGGTSFHQAEAGVIARSSRSTNEAALIVAVPSTTTADIRLTHLIPTTPSFKHSLNQTPPSPSTSFFHQSSRPHITLAIWDEKHKVELRISSALTVRVQAMITEMKRLVELSRDQSSSSSSFSWLSYHPVRPPNMELSDDEEETSTPALDSAMSASSSSTSILTLQGQASGLAISPHTAKDEYPNPFDPSFSRVAFLRERLYARQERWSERQTIGIRLATYNVNDKLPPPGTTELAPLVGEGEEDVLVFGFQEVDLRSQALLYSQGNERADEWEAAILHSLKDKAGEYEKIAMTQYVGVVTIVFVKKALKGAISRVETCEKGIGLLGFGGNKAGVCVRMKIHDSTFCFVNSHLAAFATALERRRTDFHTLMKTLTFSQPTDIVVPAYDEFLPEHKDKLITLEDSHALFWLGDLNYRVDIEDDILRAWCDEQKWKLILEKDQLIADITAGKSFSGFQEGPIDFPPSFKYVHGSSTFDTKRSPAYTDRILHTVPRPSTVHSPSTKVTCKSYTSHEIFWSDHRPVSASYEINVRVVDADKRREEYVAAERQLDKLEEVYRPSLEVGSASLEFGEVRLRRPEVREILLRNKGKVPARFKFKPPSAEKPICKPSIWPFPNSGTVQPESEITLRITICVEEAAAKRLTLGEDDLNDVLVLQVMEGKDTFIPIQASFMPTILNLPLHILSCFSSPIRSMTLAQRKEMIPTNTEDDPYESHRGFKPVKEIWRLLEHLMDAAPLSSDVWTNPVDSERVWSLLECLDTGSDLPQGQGEVAAQCLMTLLAWIPGSLVGERAAGCEEVKDRDEAFAAIEELNQVNTNVLIGLMSVVRLCAGVEPARTDSRKKVAVVESGSIPEEEGDGSDDIVVHSRSSLDTDSTKAPNQENNPEQHKRSEPQTVDKKIVEALVPAVFGREAKVSEGKKRFVRCMLEG